MLYLHYLPFLSVKWDCKDEKLESFASGEPNKWWSCESEAGLCLPWLMPLGRTQGVQGFPFVTRAAQVRLNYREIWDFG